MNSYFVWRPTQTLLYLQEIASSDANSITALKSFRKNLESKVHNISQSTIYAMPLDSPAETSNENCLFSACLELNENNRHLENVFKKKEIKEGGFVVFTYNGPHEGLIAFCQKIFKENNWIKCLGVNGEIRTSEPMIWKYSNFFDETNKEKEIKIYVPCNYRR